MSTEVVATACFIVFATDGNWTLIRAVGIVIHDRLCHKLARQFAVIEWKRSSRIKFETNQLINNYADLLFIAREFWTSRMIANVCEENSDLTDKSVINPLLYLALSSYFKFYLPVSHLLFSRPQSNLLFTPTFPSFRMHFTFIFLYCCPHREITIVMLSLQLLAAARAEANG